MKKDEIEINGNPNPELPPRGPICQVKIETSPS